MSWSVMAALFGALVVLAAVPSVSVLTVTARAAASGFVHGVFATLGIVAGDVVFILIALLGLAFLAENLGDLFLVVKYAGGAYLVWLGIGLWRSRAANAGTRGHQRTSLLSSFMIGFLVTLGDSKAILFYLVFFPAFVDMSALSARDIGVVIAVAIVAVGGVKLVYAYAADRAGYLMSERTSRIMNIAAGGVMVAVGIVLVATA